MLAQTGRPPGAAWMPIVYDLVDRPGTSPRTVMRKLRFLPKGHP